MKNNDIIHVTTIIYTGYMFKSRNLVRAQTSAYFILYLYIDLFVETDELYNSI